MSSDPIKDCAAKVLETCHMMMRSNRADMERTSPSPLSLRQTFAMLVIREERGVSLSSLSDHIGGSISGASKLVDALVEIGYVERQQGVEDRRTLMLALTPKGTEMLEQFDRHEISVLTARLRSLSDVECAMVNLVMDLLRGTLAPQGADRKSEKGDRKE